MQVKKRVTLDDLELYSKSRKSLKSITRKNTNKENQDLNAGYFIPVSQLKENSSCYFSNSRKYASSLENTRRHEREKDKELLASNILSSKNSDSSYIFSQNALIDHNKNPDYVYTVNKSSVIRSALRLADKYFGSSKYKHYKLNSQTSNEESLICSSSQSDKIDSSSSSYSLSINSCDRNSSTNIKKFKKRNLNLIKEESEIYGKDFEDYNLDHNSDLEPSSPSLLTHKFLPSNYKDKENYKQNLFKFLRKPEYPDFKTDTCKQQFYRNSRQLESKIIIKINIFVDNNLIKFNSIYGIKRKKVFSERKIFNAERSFQNKEAKQLHHFKIYTDKTIGFDLRWQKPLKCAVILIF